MQNVSTLLIEAGCREKIWSSEKDPDQKFHWSSHGKLLEEGVCIGKDYRKNFVPEKGVTKVYTTIEYQKVRDISAPRQKLLADLSLTMRWLDPNIRTNFSKQDIENGGVILDSESIAMIWTPDLYVWNRTRYKDSELSHIKSMILTDHHIKRMENSNRKTVVEQKYEIKAYVFCKFDFCTGRRSLFISGCNWHIIFFLIGIKRYCFI